MDTGFSVEVRFYRLCAELQPYFTALSMFDIVCDPECQIEDYLHPEWASMRFTCGIPPTAAIGREEMTRKSPFVVSGPTSMAIRFRLATARIWGLGLQPAGWAKFVDGNASDFADRAVDGSAEPAFALFAPILPMVQDSDNSPDQIADAINAYLMRHVARPEPRMTQIRATHDALRDPDVADVAELSDRVGLVPRSLERICMRYFGFPPKLLLRRQRFLRTLARYMQDPKRSWSEALDGQYHDQAQFVRDFRSFMGMTPSEYAEHPHPILTRIMAQRMADLGAAPETDLPTILRYRGEPEAEVEAKSAAAKRAGLGGRRE